MELTDLTIWEASDQISRRKLSTIELTRLYLERIERLDPQINAFITRTPEAALQAARQAEQEISLSGQRSRLHGIPLALKDLYETRGVRTTAGSPFFTGYVPEEDAAVVQSLSAAGVVFLGKLNMHEIALGVTNVNPHFGPCRNPWDLSRISGGSSGGSGAGLAARLFPGSLGSDTGGSIRIPSSLCGVVGLKPTYGRVSLRGLIPLSWHLDHAGPMARSVRDAALLLQVIAGYDPLDPNSLDMPVDDYLGQIDGGVRGWRLAVPEDEFFTEVTDPQVQAAVQAALGVFETLGARVERIAFPEARQAARANGLMTPADGAAFHRERLAEAPENFGSDVLQRLQTGAAFSSTEYILARRQQSLLRHQFTRMFGAFDLLVTPTTPVSAPPIEGPDAVEQARLLTRFTAPFNLTGLPALSLPCGFASEGLPVGLQIVAAPWAEAALLRAAYAYEGATGWSSYRPNLD